VVEALEDRLVPSSGNVDPNDWPMYNYNPQGTRDNAGEHILSPATVDRLQVKWTYPTHGPIAGTPAVVDNHVYVADEAGYVYALNRSGHEMWETRLQVGPTFSNVKITASILVTNGTLVIGDQSGRIHGLDAVTGAEEWSVTPNPNHFAAIYGSATLVGNDVAIGTSSNEWIGLATIPGYVPTFRGSLVLLDPTNGHIIWQTFTISAADSAAGAAGAPIWSTPTYDSTTNTIYTTSGNNYTLPTTGTSDSFFAVDATTGAVKWSNQRTAGDEWTVLFGDSSSQHPDYDLGDSPQVYQLGGRTVVAAGQKSGYFHVLDATTGAQVSPPLQLAPGGTVGGLFADSAYADGVNYTNGSDWPGVFAGQAPNLGVVSAVSADGAHELWHFYTPGSPDLSGVAVANGVVYFQSMLDGTLYALDAKTGLELAQVNTGGETSGPAISRGQIYLGTGEAAFVSVNPSAPLGPGSVVALGLGPSVGQDRDLVPFLATAAGTITNVNSIVEGVLTTFTTQSQQSSIGAFTSTGFEILQGTSLSGRQVFTTANGDRFVMTFAGTVQSDGSVHATFTLSAGTGQFEGIGGGGVFTTVPTSDPATFQLVALGEMFVTGHDRH
jgi:polyvinyl alcohol dehydrogenase (cytochrome)